MPCRRLLWPLALALPTVSPAVAQEWDTLDLVQALAPHGGWSTGSGGQDRPHLNGGHPKLRPDAAAPLGVVHAAPPTPGQWRFSYHYELHAFDGLRSGRDDFSTNEILGAGYAEAPEEMTWRTHTFELTRAWRKDWAWYVSVPVHEKELEGATAGGSYDQESSGLGDVQVGLIKTLWENESQRFAVHLGLGVPTGSVDEEGDAPGGGDVRLPYPMQLGTGTYDLHPGATWTHELPGWAWGLAVTGRVHLEKNDEDYALGDSARTSAWAALPMGERFAAALRLDYSSWGDYHGRSPELDPALNPLNDSTRQGGARLDLGVGLGWELARDRSRTQRLDLGIAAPVDEWLDGPQLSTEWILTFGWRTSF